MATWRLRRLLPGATAEALALLDPARGALEVPVRAELFGAARFAQHGGSLGASHEAVAAARYSTRFFPRLRDNIAVLREAHRFIGQTERTGLHVTPAGEWLLDNFHIVGAQLKEIVDGLPRRYFQNLPVLAGEHLAGLPRIYGVAWAFVAHTDSAFDEVLLVAFLNAYQQARELHLGELWALPTTLRVVLVENLRRLAERVAALKAAREAANLWCDQLSMEPASDARPLFEALAARGAGQAFAVQLAQRLNHPTAANFCPADGRVRRWLAHVLPDAAAAHAQQQAEEAADNLSVSNAITSLRLLGDTDWRTVIGRTSVLMQLMQQSAVYRAERNDTQDETLHAIERLARRSGASELAVARGLLQCMQTAPGSDGDEVALESPRYWLSGAGRAPLRHTLGLRPATQWPWVEWRHRAVVPAYLGTVILGSVGLTAWFVLHFASGTHASPLVLFLVALLTLGPASEAVIAVVNRLISESLRPRRLPRLALSDGIPPEHRVIVVVPTLLTSETAAQALAGQLECHHLANPEANAQFALLTDPLDADTEVIATDAPLLAAAVAALESLNRRYPPAPGAPLRFVLLHRGRRFSETEQRWIGWERKRGKLEQLVGLLAHAPGSSDGSPFVDLGPLSVVATGTPYIVTLDGDTQLPPGVLRQLVGVAAHPMNQPRLDVPRRCVTSGYGILQPRVGTPLPRPDEATPFHWLFAGQCGVDPYSAASSEVYQDLFAEGTFTGKGLLNVAAMHAVLSNRLPQEAVLSHDLLEGAIARCGGVSDVMLIEDAPVHADVAASRVHRWTRGDWQLLPLLARAGRFGIRAIDRWKMIDNLRRSLVAPLALGLLLASLAGWGVGPGAALLLVAAAFGAGPMLGAIAGLAPGRDEIVLRHFYRLAISELARALGGTLWHLAQLLAQAALSVDAIVRACYRMGWSRRGLLQWTTADAAHATVARSLAGIARQHVREPLAASALFVALLALRTPTPWIAGTLCLLWAFAPVLTWWASRPRGASGREALTPADRDYLLDVARDTWRLFEHAVGPEDHDLPPDNLQAFPRTMVAHRTSPTNIGLYLVATACAQRFGWIGVSDLLARGERTLATLGALPRHNGHFLNWYDTQTLQILSPAYVSTVDSGNLCASLIATAQACEALAAAPAGSEGAARSAIAASRRRLAAHGAAVYALVQRGALQGLLTTDDPLARMRADRPAFEALLRLAAADLPLHPLETDAGGEVEGSTEPSALAVAGQLVRDHIGTLRSLAQDAAGDTAHFQQRLLALATDCRRIAEEAEFAFLFNRRRRLFHIGYRVSEGQLDASFYDLLASESRTASLWAIAKGDVPVAHWAALGRPFFAEGSGAGLRSWSGSMFEYLMPTLLLDEPRGSVLESAAQVAMKAQIAFAGTRGVPWGISESAYAASDHTLAYQYAPQGVPVLALRRTPVDELVIAPYATALAAMLSPVDAAINLRRLEALHAREPRGFIEALDYTPERQEGQAAATRVVTFMAHHHGMTIVALANVLLDAAPRRWAMTEPRLRAVASLLQERVPREVSMLLELQPALADTDRRQGGPMLRREIVPGAAALQPTHLLSNGRYSVALRANGAGWSRFETRFISRWRDDALRDAQGMFFYVRRGEHDAPVSITQHPAPDPSAHYEAVFHSDRVCFEAHWSDMQSRCEVWVSPEDDIELRRIELRNLGDRAIEIDLMSAFDVSLTDARADEAHPAFVNLFVRADWNAAERALYLERRPRLATDQGLHAVHFVAQADRHVLATQVTADRDRWLGRHRDAAHPRARHDNGVDASGERVTGLDPVASLGLRVRLPAHGMVQLCIATAAAPSRALLELLVEKYQRPAIIDRSSLMSATLAAIRLRELRVSAATLAAIQLLSTTLALLVSRELPVAADASFDRRALWRFGISGDRPIVLVTAGAAQATGMVRALVQALRLWTWGGLPCDLVVINDEPASYLMPLQRELTAIRERFAAETETSLPAARTCALHILRAGDIAPNERASFAGLARISLNADGRPLGRHVNELVEWHDRALDERLSQSTTSFPRPGRAVDAWPSKREFSDDGARFAFDVSATQRPARPWINVLANPGFGTHVSEAGAGATWAGNSQLHQLSAWSNDAVTDPASEWILLQDLRTREVWNAAPGAGCAAAVYRVEHRQGSTSIRHRRGDVEVQLTWCVDTARALKQVQIRLINRGSHIQRLRVIGMVEWLMGAMRADRQSVSTAHMALRMPDRTADRAEPMPLLTATQRDAHGGFGGTTAFVMLQRPATPGNPVIDWTCDRREFFDARGQLVVPENLGERCGAGLDPCAAVAATLTLDAGAATMCTLLIGHADTAQAAHALAVEALAVAPPLRLQLAHAQWDALLGAVQVHTPDRLFDALVNRWLLYQTVACRLWARAGFYQAGGAFGFRDQLQDAMALAVTEPSLLRSQLLLAASRQFPEGDVQHWWHAPTGAGVRTHFSDDLLWLAYATTHYIETTGDAAVLDEVVPFLDGQAIPPSAEDAFFVAQESTQSATLFEHCARAIDRSLAVGVHGLPLMGTGDWNDGMNRVGFEGRGESVWLGWFLCRLVADFSPVAIDRGEVRRAARWQKAAQGWRAALHGAAWDGEWFVRAFFDDGSALGSKRNAECRIDLIAQAWAVLSGVALPAQQDRAMGAVQRLLVDTPAGLVRLLDPPLAHAQPSAGYIQAYPPGVRENGGQYSHGAVWALMAHAELGQRDAAWRMFTMLSPAHRSSEPSQDAAYGLEPYVMAGDVYTQPPYVGRGGWSWYTGSAAWMHRAAVEAIIGLRVRGGRACLRPQLPSHWPRVVVTLRRDQRVHEFIVCAAGNDASVVEARRQGALPLAAGEWLVLSEAGSASRHVVSMEPDALQPAVRPANTVPAEGVR